MNSQTHHSQKQRVFKQFYQEPQTMLQVAVKTGILRANICRLVAKFRKRKQITVVGIGRCPISKHKAQFFTTNPDQFPRKQRKDAE